MERVNNIFLRIDKKALIAAGSVFLTLLIGLSFLKITVNIIFPGNELGILIKDSFKELFGKAVRFDTLYFRYNGDIVLQNVYISNRTDFNDNINLIKCSEIIINTGTLDLLRKKISISEVYMNEPEITIIKNYGKTYYDVISDYFISGINKDRMNTIFSDGLKIKINDASGTFREVFRNGKTVFELDDLDITIKYKNSELHYSISGDIRQKSGKFFPDCSFNAGGLVNTETFKSESTVSLSDFNMENLSEFLKDKEIDQYIFKGDISADIDISTENSLTRLNGNIEFDDLECSRITEKNPELICVDEDIDADFNFYFSKDMGIIKVEKFRADDGIFRFQSTMDYRRDDTLAVTFNTNSINLKKLSSTVKPFRDCDYSGNLEVNAGFVYKFQELKPESISINISLDRFNLIPRKNSSARQRSITDCNLHFILDRDKIGLKSRLNTGKSDIDFNLTSTIKQWAPLTSDTSIIINSEKIEYSLLTSGIIMAVKYVYDEAFIDMFQNFDEQRNFLKEPEGIFVTSNNISLSMNVKSLLLTGNAVLNNLGLNIELMKGMLRTTAFTLEGYSGTYNMDFYGSLKQEYPFIRLEGSVKDIDLQQLSDNASLPYSFAGRLSFDYKFETNAYRIGQVIENGNASINVSVDSGRITNHPIQKKLQDNIILNGYNCDSLADVSFDSFTIGFTQSGDQFYFKNFGMRGNAAGFGGYGRFYSDGDGIDLPFNLVLSSAHETIRVPLLIYGNLLAPCIKVNTKTSRGTVCF